MRENYLKFARSTAVTIAVDEATLCATHALVRGVALARCGLHCARDGDRHQHRDQHSRSATDRADGARLRSRGCDPVGHQPVVARRANEAGHAHATRELYGHAASRWRPIWGRHRLVRHQRASVGRKPGHPAIHSQGSLRVHSRAHDRRPRVSRCRMRQSGDRLPRVQPSLHDRRPVRSARIVLRRRRSM